MGKSCFLRNSNNRRTVQSILLVKKLSGLVEMACRLVNASNQLAQMAISKNDFLCTLIGRSSFVLFWGRHLNRCCSHDRRLCNP